MDFLLNPRFVAGAVMQAVALGVSSNTDVNTSHATRSVGTLLLATLLIIGTIIAYVSPQRSFALLLPLMRMDLVFMLFAQLARSLVWASRLAPNVLLYDSEVFPLQGAAIIWNDCRQVMPHTPAEDERSVLLDWLSVQVELWRPNAFDGFFSRLLKLPFFAVVAILLAICTAVENFMGTVWHVVFHRPHRNRTPVLLNGSRVEALGHTVLLPEHHQTWIQRFTAAPNPGITMPQRREARRVTINALHVASLLSHGGHTRLHTHAPGNHAMSEYYAAVNGNELLKNSLSRVDQLRIFLTLPNGNATERGRPVPRQVLWARIVVGALGSLRGEHRWRRPVAVAIFHVAQANLVAFGADRAALSRHVYTVLRRWLVDWMFFVWWNTNLRNEIVEQPDELFPTLERILCDNVISNTASLPHAASELAVSVDRSASVNACLSLTLGPDWETWFENAVIEDGAALLEAVQASGEWKCVGRQVAPNDSVDSSLYSERRLQDVLDGAIEGDRGMQVRVVVARRIVSTLSMRLRAAWDALPEHLSEAPELG